jgi:hypothetical protein
VSKVGEFRDQHKFTQLNVYIDADTKHQFARICKARKITQREAIERLLIGWITGKIQLP